MKAFHFGAVTGIEVRDAKEEYGDTTLWITLKNQARGTETTLTVNKSQLEAILKDLK